MDLLGDDHPVALATLVDARVTASATVLVAWPARPGHQLIRWSQIEAVARRQLDGRWIRHLHQSTHLHGGHVDQHVRGVALWRLIIVTHHRHIGHRREPVTQSLHHPPLEIVTVHLGQSAEPHFRIVRPVRRTAFPDRHGRLVVAARAAADRLDRVERAVFVTTRRDGDTAAASD